MLLFDARISQDCHDLNMVSKLALGPCPPVFTCEGFGTSTPFFVCVCGCFCAPVVVPERLQSLKCYCLITYQKYLSDPDQ